MPKSRCHYDDNRLSQNQGMAKKGFVVSFVDKQLNGVLKEKNIGTKALGKLNGIRGNKIIEKYNACFSPLDGEGGGHCIAGLARNETNCN